MPIMAAQVDQSGWIICAALEMRVVFSTAQTIECLSPAIMGMMLEWIVLVSG